MKQPLQTIQTAIAIQQEHQATATTVATLQVLSLFGLTPQIITEETIQDNLNLPETSLIVLIENQIRSILTKLRRNNYAGAVVILSSTPPKQIKQKYSYLLQYSASTNNIIWRSPYNIIDIIGKINRLEPLSHDNLKLLQENFEKAGNQIIQKINILQELINQLPKTSPTSKERQKQVDQIEQQFETLFSPLSKHTRINLISYGENTISAHFRHFLKEIKQTSQPIDQQSDLLNQIIQILHQQIKELGEDLPTLSEE